MSPFNTVGPALIDILPEAVLLVREDRIVAANATARRLFDPADHGLTELELDAILAPGEMDRLFSRKKLRLRGVPVPQTVRIRFVPRGGGPDVPCDLRVAAVDCPEGEAVVLSAREATEAARAEALISRLARISADGHVMMRVEALLDASAVVFEALGWRGALFAVVGENATLERVIGTVTGNPLSAFIDRLRDAGQIPLERLPFASEVLRTREPIFLDDIAHRYGPAPEYGLHFSDASVSSGFTRAAWVPITAAEDTNHVLIVVGRDLNEYDFVAIQLIGAQIGAAIRLGALHKELVRRERFAAVGEMAAVLAHEVRNPLGVIFNAIAGLKRLTGNGEDVRKLLDILREEADRLKRLVSDLVDFARPAAPEFQPVDLAWVVRQALGGVSRPRSAPEPERCLDLQIPEGLPPAHGDPVLLRKALVNMLDNAFQAAPGGPVRVFAEAAGPRELRLSIYNGGPVIPEAEAARIFEPFFTTRATGTGLGLPVVRQIVEDLRGRIQLDSTEEGVSFSVWLRAARPPSEETD